MKLFDDSVMVREAKKAKFQAHPALQVFLFAVVFFMASSIAAIPAAVVLVVELFSGESVLVTWMENVNIRSFAGDELSGLVTDLMNSLPASYLLATLFGTGITTILVIIYCRFIEKRSLSSMGFMKKNAVIRYIVGYLLGILFIAVAVGICVLTGAYSFDGVSSTLSIGLLLLFFFGFLLQGMSEEVLLRSYLMISLKNKTPIVAAVMINSVLFALLHIFNAGITPLSLLNLILFGVFASVFTLVTDNIWGICALHSAWNFTQGNLFGIEVSGSNVFTTVFSVTPNKDMVLLHGGSFGLEGGLVVTVLLLLGTGVLLGVKKGKKKETAEIFA